MRLEVIPVEVFKNHKIFEQYLIKTSKEDIFFDIDYLFVNNKHEDGISYVALLVEDTEILASFAFVKRSYIHNNHEYYDLITPYEYGGVLTFSNNKSVFYEFYSRFENYCIKNNIITIFQRIDPFLRENLATYNKYLNLTKANDNVYLDLNQSEDQIFNNFHKNNRRDVRYAIKNGVSVECYNSSSEAIGVFLELYKRTMDSKGAKSFYYFNDEYFEALKCLSPDKLDVFIAYSKENNPISAALILKKGFYSHYHLSGTNRDYTKLCGNNLLLYKAILKMKSEGKLYFHLGGAAKSQNGLYRFKKKFSNHTIPYYISKKVLNTYLYNKINEELILTGDLKKEDINNSDFFPLYRKK